MKIFYTAFFVRTSDQKLLKRFSTRAINRFFWQKEIEAQLHSVMDKYDLTKAEVTVREYDGVVDSED